VRHADNLPLCAGHPRQYTHPRHEIRNEAEARMKIVVLVKHVPDTAADRHFAADLTLDRTAAPGRLNEPDEYALDQALRIAKLRPGVLITALTMGPRDAQATLRRALALGAHRGMHVVDDALHGSDALTTSRVLAAAVDRLGFDLVLCGTASTDAGTCMVPPMLAERLGVAALCFADTLRIEGGEAVGRRESETAVEEVAVPLPAVVSVTDRSGRPRLPSVRALAEARQTPLRTWALADLGIPAQEVGLAAAATVVRMVIPHTRRAAGGVIRDDERGGAAVGLADFLTERHFI
jgi:electron transfer flavoprotein beta subunit